MKHLFYLIGVPGAGKTTLIRSMTEGIAAVTHSQPISHTVYHGGVTQLGVERETFGGTDTLPMNVQPKAVHFLFTEKPDYVFAEGDRLANDSFFTMVQKLGYKLTVALLHCDEPLAAARRHQRGSNQNATWLRGRTTKVKNLAEAWVWNEWVLDATHPIEKLAARLSIHPVFKALNDGKETNE